LSKPEGRLSIAALSEVGRKESNSGLRTILLRYLNHNSRERLLDIGGGSGLLTETLADVFSQILVLEPNLGKLEYGAKHRPDVGFIRGSAQQVPVVEGKIGTVVSVAAFHHFPDQHGALEEMKRVLKPGGLLMLAEIDVSKTSGRILRFFENKIVHGGSHFLESPQLVEMVKGHGFSDIAIDRTSRGYVVVAKNNPT